MEYREDITGFHGKFTSPVKVSYLERRWKEILEEERASYARNQKLLDDFVQVEEQMMLFSQRNDSLKHAKQTFENYVRSVYPKWDKEMKRLKKQKKLQKITNGKLTTVHGDAVNSGEFSTKHHSPMTSTFTNNYHQNIDSQSTYLPRNDQYDYYGNNVPYHFGYPMNPQQMIGLNWSQFSNSPNNHQSYGQTRPNYIRHPGHVTDTIPRYHPPPLNMYDGYEKQMTTRDFGERSKSEQGFNESYSRRTEGSFRSIDGSIRNISEERFREFEKWEKSVYGGQWNGAKNTSQTPQPSISTSNMCTSQDEQRNLLHENLHNTHDIPEAMNKENTVIIEKPEEISTFGKRIGMVDNIKESVVNNNDKNSDVIELSESQSNEMKPTASVSFPSCYQLEGELKDYYSSDTDQIIEEVDSNSISTHCVEQTTNNRQPCDGKDNSNGEKTHLLSKTAVQLSSDKPRDEVLSKDLSENSKAIQEAMGNSNSVDNILGGTISDFEVSDVSDDGEEDIEILNESTSIDVSRNISSNQSAIDQESGAKEMNGNDEHQKKDDDFKNELDDEETQKESYLDGTVEEKQAVVDISTEISDVALSRSEDVPTVKDSLVDEKEIDNDDSSLNENNSTVDKTQEVDDNEISVDEEILLELIRVIDDDIEVSFSTELLYRHDICTIEQKQHIIRSVKCKESLEKYETAVISMLVLDQLPNVVESLTENGLLSENILVNEQKYVHEKDLRAVIDRSLQTLWKHLYSHFIKIIEYDVMKAEEIAEIFAPCLGVLKEMVDKAINLLSRIIRGFQEEYENTDDIVSGRNEKESESVSSSEEEPLSEKKSGSKKEKSEDLNDDIEEKSASLNETDAYQKMLSSLKINDGNDVIDDLEDDLELTMSEANTSGQLKHATIDHQHAAGTSNHKLPLLKNQMVDDGSPVSNASWKSSEASTPPLTPDFTNSGYIPTIVSKETKQGKKTETSANNKSDTKSRIKSGFWNKSDSESEVDFEISHGENVDNNDDDFDFYS